MATATQGPDVRKVATKEGGTAGLHGERLELLLAGVAPLLLGLAGLIVLEGPADRPELNQSPAVILSYFGKQDTVILGSFLLTLAALAFIWFAGSLRAVLRRKEGGEGRLSAIAFGGAVVAGVFMLAMPAANLVGALLVEQLSATQAQTFYFLGDVFLYPAAMGAAVFVGATALVALRTTLLPRWAAWLSLALGVWLVIPPLGQGVDALENPAPWTGLAVLPFVLVWTALIAVGLMRATDE
jgi:hypothetical protein